MLQILVIDEDLHFRQAVMEAMHGSDLQPELLVRGTAPGPSIRETLAHEDAISDLVVVLNWDAAPDPAISVMTLKQQFPYVSIVVSSASNSLLVPQQAIAAGVAGFFRRDSPALLIRAVLELVFGGEAFALPDHLRSSRPRQS